MREVLARVKDFGTSIFKPEPTYLGETIPIWGDGNLTNDENSDFIMEMGVMTIPCLVLFVGGEEKGRLIGYNEKEAILSFIEENK